MVSRLGRRLPDAMRLSSASRRWIPKVGSQCNIDTSSREHHIKSRTIVLSCPANKCITTSVHSKPDKASFLLESAPWNPQDGSRWWTECVRLLRPNAAAKGRDVQCALKRLVNPLFFRHVDRVHMQNRRSTRRKRRGTNQVARFSGEDSQSVPA